MILSKTKTSAKIFVTWMYHMSVIDSCMIGPEDRL